MNKQEQKQHLIDLMNMKTIEEVAEEYSKSGSWQCPVSFSDGANYQKQIDENLDVEFAEWLIDTENKPKGEFTVKQLFDIFQSERTKKA